MMTENETQKEGITEAGAVELDEARLDDASGGLLPANKYSPEVKLDPSINDPMQKVTPELKFNPPSLKH